MKKLKQFLQPPLWIVLLASCAFPCLVWLFLNHYESQWFSYPVYVLSAYGLTVLSIRLVPWAIRFFRQRRQKQPAESAEEQQKLFCRDQVKDMLVNFGFGLFYLAGGIRNASAWLVANGIYNLVQGGLYGIPLYYQRKLTQHHDLKTAWKGYTTLGWGLLAVNLTMTGCVFLVVWRGESESYDGLLVFAMATLTFYKLAMSIISLVQIRHSNSPLLGAACNAGHTEAIMSLFMLQTALFSSFGQDFPHKFLMNSLTGGAVCLMTVLGAAGMVLHGRKRMTEAEVTNNGQ